MIGFSKKITEAIGNPFVWILVAALAFASYGNYRRAQIVSHLCALTSPHDVTVAASNTPRGELDTICNGREWETVPNRIRGALSNL
jgi:hypothetical protein